MTASEKVAYLKGLAEGLGVKDDGKEGKLMRSPAPSAARS